MTDRPSAVRLFAPEHHAIPHTLRAKLEQRRNELTGQLVSAQDWPDFRHRTGVIAGLSEAMLLCLETEKDLNGE